MAAAPEFVSAIMSHDLMLLRDDFALTVVTSPGLPLDSLARENIEVVNVAIERKMAIIADVRSLWRLYRLFRARRFDVVHTYTPKAGLLGQLGACMAGVRVRLHSVRGLLYAATTGVLRRWLFSFTDALTARLAHRVVFNSAADFDYAIAKGLCSPHKARYAGNGVDLTLFDPDRFDEARRRETREHLGVGQNHVLCLTVGRFVRDKGYPELAIAIAQMRQRVPQARFVWVAPVISGEDGIVDRSILEHLGIADVVRLLPWSDDMPVMYAAADLLVHPSHREGAPRAVLEALVMGVPVIAADIPITRRLKQELPAAIELVPVADVAALASAMSAAIAQRRRVPPEEMRSARVLFDHKRVAEEVRAVYRELGFDVGRH